MSRLGPNVSRCGGSPAGAATPNIILRRQPKNLVAIDSTLAESEGPLSTLVVIR